MPGNPDGRERLKGYHPGPDIGYDYFPNERDDLLRIDHGVLFLMAFWSAPAIIAFENLCQALDNTELPDGFRFRVLDIDGATNSLADLATHDVILGGNGEAYWFKNGETFTATSVATATDDQIRKIVNASTAASILPNETESD